MVSLDKIKALLGTLAPSIASALGGPVAGMAVGALSKAVLGDATAGQTDTGKLESAVLATTDPNVYAAIKKADQEFAVLMDQHGIDLEKIAADDRASARQRQASLKDSAPTILGYTVVALTITLEAYVLLHGTPAGIDPVIVGRILGTLDAGLTIVLSYYFGSSAGSSRKTELMAGNGTPKN